MDEYYALDYEDLIGGDLPTRFKYASVPASGFGITDEELMHGDEKKLSKRVPLKFVKRPYDTKLDVAKLKSRGNRVRWEEKRMERVNEAVTEANARAKAEAVASKKEARARRKQQQQQQAEGGQASAEATAEGRAAGADAAGGGKKLKRSREQADADAGGSDEKLDGDEKPEGGEKKRKKSKSPKAEKLMQSAADAAEAEAKAKTDAKAAKLLAKGMSASRLETYAKLAKAGKKKQRTKARFAGPELAFE